MSAQLVTSRHMRESRTTEIPRHYAENDTIGASEYGCPGVAGTTRGVTPEGSVPMPPQYTPSSPARICEECGAPLSGTPYDRTRFCCRACYVAFTRRPKTPPAERFWDRVDQSGDCWIWLAGKDKHGYGFCRWGGETKRAHRLAWELTNGPIPEGMAVCHRCDNPPCVNPSHLFLGTHADNARDRSRKGRSARQYGRQNGRAKLTPSDIRYLYAFAAAGISQRRIAALLECSQGLVGDILRGRVRKGPAGGDDDN